MFFDSTLQFIPKSVRENFRKGYEKVRRRSMTDFFSQFINEGSLVFDIGANVGDYAKIFLGCGAKVVCIDPHPFCVSMLKERFGNNPNVIIVPKGLAEKEGEMTLFIDPKNHATSTFSEKFKSKGPYKNRKWSKKLTVPVTTFDRLIQEFGVPDFCKIDTEGYETQVLQGLSRPIHYMMFEYAKDLSDDAIYCMKYAQRFGKIKYNFSSAFTSTSLNLKDWTGDYSYVVQEIKNKPFAAVGDIFMEIN